MGKILDFYKTCSLLTCHTCTCCCSREIFCSTCSCVANKCVMSAGVTSVAVFGLQMRTGGHLQPDKRVATWMTRLLYVEPALPHLGGRLSGRNWIGDRLRLRGSVVAPSVSRRRQKRWRRLLERSAQKLRFHVQGCCLQKCRHQPSKAN